MAKKHSQGKSPTKTQARFTPDVSPRLPVLANAAHLIALRLDGMLAYEPFLDNPDNVYELHEMRIAAKRLRYTMEIFQDVYTLYTPVGLEFAACLKAVKDLQEHLGVLHDADVLVPQLLEHLARITQPGYGMQKAEIAHAPLDAHGKRKSKHEGQKSNPASLPTHTETLPIAGVHRVDYLACQGLLNLCVQTRTDRDARYTQLIEAWGKLREERLFERLRALLAVQEEKREEGGLPLVDMREGEQTPAFPLPLAPSAMGSPVSAPDTEATNAADGSTASNALSTNDSPALQDDRPDGQMDAEDAANRQITQIQRAPGEPGHVAAARRRASAGGKRKADLPQAGSAEGSRQAKTGNGNGKRGAKPAPLSPRPAAHRNGAARHSRTGADKDSGA